MRRGNRGAIAGATPVLALAAATCIGMIWSRSDAGASQEVSADLAAGVQKQVGAKKPSFRFSEGDIGPVVAAMRAQGISEFVCWIDPTTGSLSVVDGGGLRPHLDLRPGKCPNNIHVEHCGGGGGGDDGDDDDGGDGGGHGGHAAALAAVVMHVGLLGNAFDVTGVDLGSVRLSLANTVLPTGELAPLDTSFLDVGTPFEHDACQCTTAGSDGTLDISMHFDQQAMIDTFGLDGFPNHADVELKMTGMVIGGHAIFAAEDCLRIVTN